MCDHLISHKGRYIVDNQGVRRRCSELLGDVNMKNGGVEFCEASWLTEPPASGLATIRNVLPSGKAGSVVIAMPTECAKKEAITRYL